MKNIKSMSGKKKVASIKSRKNGDYRASYEYLIREKLRNVVDKMDHQSENDLYRLVIETTERPLIELVLERTAGNQCKAANMLGINRNTLRKKIYQLGIDPRYSKTC